jgi:hypothetical protein
MQTAVALALPLFTVRCFCFCLLHLPSLSLSLVVLCVCVLFVISVSLIKGGGFQFGLRVGAMCRWQVPRQRQCKCTVHSAQCTVHITSLATSQYQCASVSLQAHHIADRGGVVGGVVVLAVHRAV